MPVHPQPNRGVFSEKSSCSPNPDLACTPNGAYATNFAGDPGSAIPAGVFVGFEDTSWVADNTSDRDYDDSEYVFTNLQLTTSN